MNDVGKTLLDTEFWHGTGASHYAVNKYGEIPPDPDKIDLLGDILEQGIVPKEDLFNALSPNTTSMTKAHAYARVYAYLNRWEGDEAISDHSTRAGLCAAVFGEIFRRKVRSLVGDLSQGRLTRTHKPAIEFNLGRIVKIYGRSRNWSTTFRKDGKFQRRMSGVLWAGNSDNPDNFPVVVGVKKGEISGLLPIKEVETFFEQRVNEIIPPSSLSCITVPRNKVGFVKENYTTNVPIVAIEDIIEHERGLYPSLTAMMESVNIYEQDIPNSFGSQADFCQLVDKCTSSNTPIDYDTYAQSQHFGASHDRHSIVKSLRNGIWGKQAAGILVKCGNNVLLLRRSIFNSGGRRKLGITGGAVKYYEDGTLEHPLISAVNETKTEMDYLPHGSITRTHVLDKSDFKYTTFILEVDEKERLEIEKNLRLNWEHTGFEWVSIDEIKSGKRTDVFGPVADMARGV